MNKNPIEHGNTANYTFCGILYFGLCADYRPSGTPYTNMDELFHDAGLHGWTYVSMP